MFTLGEWIYERISGSPQSTIHNGKVIIAGIPNCRDGEDSAETDANGNLIAAAPSMYSALKDSEWVGMYDEESSQIKEQCPYCYNYKQEGHVKLCEIGLAIAKAEGRTT